MDDLSRRKFIIGSAAATVALAVIDPTQAVAEFKLSGISQQPAVLRKICGVQVSAIEPLRKASTVTVSTQSALMPSRPLLRYHHAGIFFLWQSFGPDNELILLPQEWLVIDVDPCPIRTYVDLKYTVDGRYYVETFHFPEAVSLGCTPMDLEPKPLSNVDGTSV